MIEIIFVESNIETLEPNIKELEDKGEAQLISRNNFCFKVNEK